MRRAERLFRLVHELRTRRISRADDLATHLEVSARTVYRDIAHLQASGLPIEGEAGVGYILRPGFDLPAMTFTFEQLEALAMGLSFVEANGDRSLADAAAEVRSKLQASLPEANQRKLQDAPFFATRRSGRAPQFAAVIRRAIRRSTVLQLDYEDDRGRRSSRHVRPLALWAFTDGWLFAAWCELRSDFRAFRLDRVSAIRETQDAFADDPSRNLRAYLQKKFLGTLPEVRRESAGLGGAGHRST